MISESKRKSIIRDLSEGCRQYLLANPNATKAEVRAAMLDFMRRESARAGDDFLTAGAIIYTAETLYDEVWKAANAPDVLN